eukprot:CAMPEP_0114532178 /NCGR_PEP_ID=MMETSP0109-20121206/26516_1 /TAXON_ID=29199 /ORGANISM="Chlorarachnion reptans, Strain CCCM449" /LENGTH=439 /DNA_ID=CAMNT_0001715203 /DNA_START=156 /DNA_END=1476 /DNA_ORIENTATION=-
MAAAIVLQEGGGGAAGRARPQGARLFGSSPATTQEETLDVAIIGGGIIGCATARELLERRPDLKLGILEKEDGLGMHQTSHNSGVIHAGMYYKPGSMKAKFCVAGMKKMYDYCDKKKIPYRKNGKLIMAIREDEVEGLENIMERGLQNGVPGLEMVDADGIRQIEPNASGIKAVWSPATGIVDFQQVCFGYAEDVKEHGGTITKGFKMEKLAAEKDAVRIFSSDGREVLARKVITCAGLYSDHVAKSGGGGAMDPQIAPFRGAWLTVKQEYLDIVKANIYPVPDPRFPFLGVHFTPTMKNELLLGPNATLAFQREGYRYRDVNFSEFLQTLAHPGLQKTMAQHIATGVKEMFRDFVIDANLRRLQQYVPTLSKEMIEGWKSGVRAIAIDQNGILDEFVIEEGIPGRVINIRNAPSPACTASLRIAEEVVDRAEHLGFFR